MQTTLDRFGRIVIPKKVREDFNLKPGSQIRIEETEDTIVLKPIQGEPHLIEKNGVLIFSGKSLDDIEKSLKQHRENRLNKIGGNLEDTV